MGFVGFVVVYCLFMCFFRQCFGVPGWGLRCVADSFLDSFLDCLYFLIRKVMVGIGIGGMGLVCCWWDMEFFGFW